MVIVVIKPDTGWPSLYFEFMVSNLMLGSVLVLIFGDCLILNSGASSDTGW